ncbi:hypothetical protein ACFLZB_01100 [Nanoarchaeota archaeon]
MKLAKKAQLYALEGKFAILGLIIGIVLGLVFIYLANHGIVIPFKLSFLCPSLPATP